MDNSINSYIPKEVLPTIFSFFPIYDKLRMIPLVSCLWNSIVKESNRIFYQEFTRKILINEIESYKFCDPQIDLIIEMVKKNHFISLIEKNTSRFSYNRTDFFEFTPNLSSSLELNKPFERSISYFNSNSFELFCNLKDPTKISNVNDKRSNFRTSIIIEVAIEIFLYKRSILNNCFKINAVHSCSTEEKGVIFWNKLDSQKIKPLKPKNLIKHAIYMQLRLYVAYFSHLNMITLADVKLEDFKGDYPHLTFRCNKLGQIKLNVSSKEAEVLLIIEKKQVQEDLFFYVWKSSDDQMGKKEFYKAEDLLRWSIFSETLQQLSQKLGH